MVSCCPGRTFKVPHVTSRIQLAKFIKFFVRAFIVGMGLINIVVLIISILTRLKLGPPTECSDIQENVYLSTYTLLALCSLVFIGLILAFFRAYRFRNSGDLRGAAFMFAIVVMCEVFISIMALFQYSRVESVLESSHSKDVFTSSKCLEEIQTRHQCCGFQNLTEWPEKFLQSDDLKLLSFEFRPLSSQSAKSVHINGSSELLPTQRPFPETCHCTSGKSRSRSCVLYVSSYRNLTLGVQTASNAFYHSPNFSLSSDLTTVEYPYYESGNFSGSIVTTEGLVHGQTCFDYIKGDFNEVYTATGLSAIVTALLQVAIFVIQFYIIHNMEGASTISDNYQPTNHEVHNGAQTNRLHISYVDLNTMHLQPCPTPGSEATVTSDLRGRGENTDDNNLSSDKTDCAPWAVTTERILCVKPADPS